MVILLLSICRREANTQIIIDENMPSWKIILNLYVYLVFNIKIILNLSQNGSAQSSEVGISTQESSLEDQQSLYQSQQPYNMYPGYMFGAPLYNYNGE